MTIARNWVAVLIGCALSVASGRAENSIRRLDGSRISVAEVESFAKETLAAHHVTGAQIAVVDRGQLVWSGAFGLRRRDPPLPFDHETTTWAASITKSVFSVYVMRLVERGQFQLDQPIVRMLPKPIDAYEPYQASASELVKDPAWRTVTPRMLLSHTAGLLNFATLESDKKMRLHFQPGTKFSYSGEGINLVQFVIEQQKGQPLSVLMADELFKPLGMTRTGLIYQKEFAADMADRYDAAEKFRSQTRRFPARAAGSMTTSADDLARFLSALLRKRLLKTETVHEMLKPILSIRSVHQFALSANEPPSRETERVGLSYGVGWGLLTHTRFGPAFFKEGHGDGAQNYVICFQKRKACMILLTNSDNGELAFRPLLEKILGDTETPWEWEGYTPSYIQAARAVQQ